MLNIVVVDDEQIQRDYMEALIQQVCQTLKVDCSITCLESSEHFLFELEEHPEWQLLFLDIEMPALDGMSLAHQIRQIAPQIEIIFATGYSEYAVAGYQVDALDFLVKPIEHSDIERVIQKYLNIQPVQEYYVLVDTVDGVSRALNANEIYWVEVNRRRLTVGLEDEHIELGETLAAFKEKLNADFISPHRSYLINLNHVSAVQANEVQMEDGTAIPLSRRLIKEVQAAFVSHYRKGAY